MTSHADLPSEAEATSIEELVADGLVVRHRLAESRQEGRTAAPQVVVIPDSALVVVAGLDAYGD